MKKGLIQIRITDERKNDWKSYAEKMGISLSSLISYAVVRFINEETNNEKRVS